MIATFATTLILVTALPQQPQESVAIRGPQPALIKLGETSRLTIVVSGKASNPGKFRLPKTSAASLELLSGGTRSQRTFRNGRLTESYTSTYYIDITPRRTGRITIPAFTFNSGSKVQTVPAKTIEVVKDIAAADRGYFRIVPSARSVYLNEPLRFRVEIGIDQRSPPVQARAQNGQDYIDVRIQAPWLEEMEGAVSIKDSENEKGVRIVLNNRALQVTEYDEQPKKGAVYHRFRFVKSFQPTQTGRLQLAAPVVEFTVHGSQRRGRFGERIQQNKKYYLYGKPITIDVKPVPTAGKPASYTNGIGRFELSAAVNKKKVKVGNSIQLTLIIAGDGNLEFLEPPDLGEIEGFHQLGVKENRDLEAVRITYDLTPLDEEVAEIPSIAWSFFDTTPGVERYVEVKTEPIAIRVDALAEGGGLATLPGEEAGSVVAGVDDIFDMKPVDAELVELPNRPGPGLAAGLLLAPWIVCLGLVGLLGNRRRRAADVLGQRAKGAAKNFERKFAEKGDAADALAAYVADRLGLPAAAVIGPDLGARLNAAGIDGELAHELQLAIDSGTAARYGGRGVLSKDDATRLMKRLHAIPIDLKKIVPGIASVLFLCAAAHGLCAQTQAPSVQEAEAAYRSGEYEQAARGFQAAAERPGADRRLFYNLGNSLYRQGQLSAALVAYESARLGMPRDHELARNIILVRRKLDLGSAEGESFLTSLARLRDQLTPVELLWLCVLCHLLAAVGIVFGRRGWRILGIVVLLPAVLISIELVLLGPARPGTAIVTEERVAVTAEPRSGLDAVLKLREGVAVAVLGEGPMWTRVRVEGREGYVPSGALGFVR